MSGNPIFRSSAPIRDGAYTLDVPVQGDGFYVVVEEPGHGITQVGPLKVGVNERKKLDVACVGGGALRGQVKNVPEGWQGNLWAVAFSRSAVRAETRVADDGTFAFDALPPGRYGLKVGHDAYKDSEVPGRNGLQSIPEDAWNKISDPWKRAVKATVTAGQTTEGLELELPAE